MIVKYLINRPIAVTMSIIAIIVVGWVSFRFIPISLMPDIDIPQITVQANYPGASVREVENKVVRHLKNQLMQVAGLKNIRSESRMDAGTIYMDFEPGCNIDLVFIEVNEKMDRAMNYMPKELERPKVLKASVTDIPAFYLNLTLKDEDKLSPDNLPIAGTRFTQLGDFARNIVAKRIEQLPQTAMVDISGEVHTELLCIPDQKKMEAMNISNRKLEQYIRDNNITLGLLKIVDGLYRYNIHFDSQLVTKEDIENIYINHEGRIYQFKDLCDVVEKPAKRKGLVRNGKNNSITMAIIKQNDARMSDLQSSIDNLLKDLRKNYDYVNFELTRDQTKLLSYSINNLKNNLFIGALLACLILFIFMRNPRSPLLIIISIPLTLIVTLLCFYMLDITLNIISLSGLILGVGMMVDNSIIVIDNITQRWHKGLLLQEAIVKATAEVFTPMLSSVLTTCSVFIPLTFLSGITGALFYDQAMAITISLLASLFVSVLFIPVYFLLFFKKQNSRKDNKKRTKYNFYKPYEFILKWVLRHQKLTTTLFFLTIPFIYIVYTQIKKQELPYIKYNDTLMYVDWNSGISIHENDKRVNDILEHVRKNIETSTSMIGVQDFFLSHTKDINTSEAIVYIKAKSEKNLNKIKNNISNYVNKKYPKCVINFKVSGNIFDMIFSDHKANLEILLQKNSGGIPSVANVREFTDTLAKTFPKVYFPPVVVEQNIHYQADLEKMSIYEVSYASLFSQLKTLVNQRDIFHINKGSFSVPVTFGVGRKQSKELLMSKIKNKNGLDIPLNLLVKETKSEDFKQLYSGNGGDFYPISIIADDNTVEDIMKFTDFFVKSNNKYYVSYMGGYFNSRKMIKELSIILLVSIALLYFILAAQFESIIQPLIILTEVTIDIFFVFLFLYLLGESLNIMSMIGIVVMSGIIINDSILKVDTINRLRRSGMGLIRAIVVGGHQRVKPIIMTSLTTILAIVPFLTRSDMGAALQYPLSLTIIIGMIVGTLVSLFFIPLVYYIIYNKK